MSESKKPPRNPPPDDFSETKPNIDLPDDDAAEWDEPAHNLPPDAPDDDWGKTVINYDSSLSTPEEDDFEETGRIDKDSPEPDWGMTKENINLGGAFEADDDFGEEEADVAATQHVIHIPEADRKKFKIPPTATEKAKKEEEEAKAQGGVPLWFWLSAALMTMFTFAVIVMLGVYFLILRDRGYEVTIQGAPLGSKFSIDGGDWGVPSVKNEWKLSGVGEGRRRIEIKHPSYTCRAEEIVLENGVNPPPIIAVCRRAGGTATKISDKACDETRVIANREQCAEQILDTLGNPPDLDRLIKALNWLIINFESGKWNIPEPRKRILTKAATHLRNLPQSVVVEIGGHTDSRDSEARNQVLSEKRANAVRDFLINIASVRPSTLTTRGYGESRPKASNETEQGRFDNRRIEYTVVRR